MVATRAMAARKAPASSDDKENDNQLALRKKPVRRAMAKTASTTTTPAAKPTRKAAAAVVEAAVPKPSPLSPKKVTQVAQGRAAETQPEQKKTASAPATRTTTTRKPALQVATTRAKRQTRTTAAPAPSTKPSPKKAPVTRRKAALPEAARGKASRTRKTKPEPEPEPEPEIETEVLEPEPEEESQHEQEVETPAEAPNVEDLHGSDEESEHGNEQEDEKDAQEPTEESEPTQPTPVMRVTRSHDSKPQSDNEEQEEEETDNESSDDEICGPKTPMRRGFTPARSQTASRQATSSATARKLHTPARRFLVHRADQGTPQTQRMPLKASRISSPPRPMTVSRGAEKVMVFRPLKPRSPEEQHMSTVDHVEQPEVQDESGSGSSADELDCGTDDVTMTMPTPARTIHFEEAASDSEDELAGQGHAVEVSEDEEDVEDTIVEEDNEKKESDYEDNQVDMTNEISDASDSDLDGSDLEDDSILPEPQFSADIAESTTSSPASVTMQPPEIDVEDSELLSSPTPSTPGSVVRHDLGNQQSPTEEVVPVSRLSISDNELLSLIEDEESATPRPKARVSFSTATAKMLQTPRMEFALGGTDPMEIDDSPSITIKEPAQHEDEKTLTINPSLLDVDEDGIQLAMKLENAATIPTPCLATPTARQRLSMGFSKERMSLMQEDIFDFINFDHASPAKLNVETPAVEATSNQAEDQEMTTPRPDVRRQSSYTAPVEHTPQNKRLSDVGSTPPSYARSTFAFDSRRQSLPVVGSMTPANAGSRPRTADTTIKPSTSDSFAKLWASKQRRPSVRRSVAGVEAVRPAESLTPRVSERLSIRKRESMPAQYSASTIQIQTQPPSPYVPFSGAKSRKHIPSSSLKHRTSSRSPVKRLREAPRTPVKTPLKGPCLATPAAYPMTPHPLQPLKAVTALVEVFTLDGSSASSPFIALLQGLGARTTKTWSDRVTHVVFKDGSPTTLQKVRLSNKEGSKKVFCVNSRWVTDCERNGSRMDEQADIYTVDVDEVPRGGRRRRKSMEPAALRNVDGNVITSSDSRGSNGSNGSRKSIGRQSVGRKSLARVSLASSFWGDDSPVKKTPKASRDSWDDDEEMADAFFDEPTAKFEVPAAGAVGFQTSSLEAGQMTAPVNRMKKMRLRDEDNRRLTFMIERE